MRSLFSLLCIGLLAAGIGLALTASAAVRGSPFGVLRIGAWTALPKAGTANADPYDRAKAARTGELPLGAGDGLMFLAHADDNGRPLDDRCDVTLSGTTPPARYWTLTAYRNGQLIGNPLGRYGLTSSEILRPSDGSVSIVLARTVRAGNWLPTGGAGPYTLAFRLYETSVGAASLPGRSRAMPAISTDACP